MVIPCLTSMNTAILGFINFLSFYHDSIIAGSVVFGGGWWFLDSIRKVHKKAVSLENKAVFDYLDDNKKAILERIVQLETYTKHHVGQLQSEIKSLADQMESNKNSVDERVSRIEDQYDFLLKTFVESHKG